MSGDSPPRVVVLAGINGAGKTTASKPLLRMPGGVPVYVNHNEIARGLNVLHPSTDAVKAARVALGYMDRLARKRNSFGFEATLTGRGLVTRLNRYKALGYQVSIFYYWLQTPSLAVARVKARAHAGGYTAPDEAVRASYTRSRNNFLRCYRYCADYWEVLDNSGSEHTTLAVGNDSVTTVLDSELWDTFVGGDENG